MYVFERKGLLKETVIGRTLEEREKNMNDVNIVCSCMK